MKIQIYYEMNFKYVSMGFKVWEDSNTYNYGKVLFAVNGKVRGSTGDGRWSGWSFS